MLIIGCDYHPYGQTIAMVDTATGELTRRNLEHPNGEAERFYRSLPPGALIGIEATGATQWFERLVAECGHELWVGDAAVIKAKQAGKPKTNERDALHLLDLLVGGQFPRLWVPSPGERDVRQLLQHRAQQVQAQTKVKGQLHGLAMAQGLCRKHKLFSRAGRELLEKLELGPWASRRRRDLLAQFDSLQPEIAELDQAVAEEGARRPEVAQLRRIKGVGPVVALAFVLTVGPIRRFLRSRQLVAYLGLNPRENSTGDHQRLGHITKQGNKMMRWLLVEAAQTAVRCDPEMHRIYARLKFRRGANVAKVAIARRLAVKMYWTLRQASERGASGSHVR